MKKCSRCGKTKPKSEFGNNAKSVDGLRYQCKACDVIASSKSRARAKGIKFPYKKPPRPADKEGKRWCSSCKDFLPVSSFGPCSSTKEGLDVFCKTCNVDRSACTRERDKRDNRSLYNHRSSMFSLNSQYNITELEFQNLMNLQKGCCAICGKDFGDLKKRACVDHDHISGQVRGLLCSRCNVFIGMAKENTSTLLKAVTYLDSWEYAI